MAKPVENEEKGDSFDLDRIRKLLQLMEKFDVSEINLQNDDESWKIRRGPRVAFAPPSPPAGYAMPMPTAPVPAPVAAGNPAAVAAAAAPTGITINAPTVGTFYSAASPEDAPFVTVGYGGQTGHRHLYDRSDESVQSDSGGESPDASSKFSWRTATPLDLVSHCFGLNRGLSGLPA